MLQLDNNVFKNVTIITSLVKNILILHNQIILQNVILMTIMSLVYYNYHSPFHTPDSTTTFGLYLFNINHSVNRSGAPIIFIFICLSNELLILHFHDNSLSYQSVFHSYQSNQSKWLSHNYPYHTMLMNKKVMWNWNWGEIFQVEEMLREVSYY
jgi:hypothetical protein